MNKDFNGVVVKDGYKLMMLMRPKMGNWHLAIIHREAVDDYVFATGYDVTDGTWAQGHYCSTYADAVDTMIKYLG